MSEQRARFAVGQVVHHRLFDYSGVIVDVDATFQGSDEWYARVARSRPPRDAPWYHVLVSGGDRQTYVAERNLEPALGAEPIVHPLLDAYFDEFRDGRYVSYRRVN